MNVHELVKKYEDFTIHMRRSFHSQPELSSKEYETTRKIKEALDSWGIECITPAETGVIALIHGKKPGKTIGLRADIDALPVQELIDCSYKSQHDGVMHACGHDVHAAALLSAARILNEVKNNFSGTVKLIFQPSEEYFPSGAKAMMSKGDLNDLDAVMTMHVRCELPLGQAAIMSGAINAGSSSVDITVTGKGGHAARPQECVDALVTASAMVMNLQTVVSRELSINNSAVFSFGTLHAGTAKNVIAETAVLSGTLRYYDVGLFSKLTEAITRIAQGTAQAYRASADVAVTPGLPPIVNDEKLAKIAKAAATELWGAESVVTLPRSTGVEDFAYYGDIAPIIQIGLGSNNGMPETLYPRHNPRHNVDERCIGRGVELYVQFALDYLKSE